MFALRGLRCGWPVVAGLAVLLVHSSLAASAAELTDKQTNPNTLRTARVTRGELVVTIGATGTVEPEELVDVAAQVTGTIRSLGADPRGKTDPQYHGKSIDFGSPVDEGTVLAKIDDRSYVAQVELAKASCARAQAELAAAKLKRELARREWQRAQDGLKGKSVSVSEYETLKANDEVAQASVSAAEASVAQARAALKQAEINLDYTVITSPLKGVVIDRRVNVGQTAMSSLNAPSLFLIAKDLKNMQVWTQVNEADVGKIRKGMPVRFTVDAFPGEVFRGTVAQIRLNAMMTQNVVTYTVVVATANPERKLLPYLTANVQFEVVRHKDVLRVPNAALAWRPKPEWVAPGPRGQGGIGSQKSEGRAGDAGKTQSQSRPRRLRVWIPEGRLVRPIDVEVGASDGAMTEITGGDVKEGTEIVVGGSVAAPDAGRGSKSTMQKALESMGTDTLLVMPGTTTPGGFIQFGSRPSTLTPQDAEEIARRCPAVGDVAPIVRARARITFGSRNWVPMQLSGTTPSFLAARGWEDMAEGAAFTEADVRNATKVCLLGQTVKRELFQEQAPIGEDVRIQNVVFRVVGVLGPKGSNVLGLDQDDIVLAPWTTVKQRITAAQPGEAPGPVRPVVVDQVLARAAAPDEVPRAIEQVRELLRERHRIRPGQEDDFAIRDMSELIKTLFPRGR